MVNRVGENPEPDLWTFDVETPGSTVSDGSGRLPSPLIDYVHPGELVWRLESKLREHVHFRPDWLNMLIGSRKCEVSLACFLVCICTQSDGFSKSRDSVLTTIRASCAKYFLTLVSLIMVSLHAPLADFEALYQDPSWRRFSAVWYLSCALHVCFRIFWNPKFVQRWVDDITCLALVIIIMFGRETKKHYCRTQYLEVVNLCSFDFKFVHLNLSVMCLVIVNYPKSMKHCEEKIYRTYTSSYCLQI